MVVKTTKNSAVAADISVVAQRWPHRLNGLIHTISGRLARPETRHTAHALLRGLLAPIPGKNCWTVSEHIGHPTPYRLQHLFSRAQVDEAGLVEDLRTYACTHLGGGSGGRRQQERTSHELLCPSP